MHYRDESGTEAAVDQWDDRLWVFEAQGDGLRWSEFPVVAFSDGSGRFSGGVRETGHWEPDASQRREIERGLEASPRGARHRTLRRTATGWSSERASGYDSARFVTWSSVLEIDLSGEVPRFTVRDALGSSAAGAIEGRTLYRGERALEGGHVIAGAYDRDGRHRGSFRMTRSGERRVHEAEAAALPEKDEVYERFYSELGRQLRTHRALPQRTGAEEQTPAGREAFERRVHEEVEVLYRAQGNDPRPHAPQVASLSGQIARLYLDEGRSRDEIGLLIEAGRVRP